MKGRLELEVVAEADHRARPGIAVCIALALFWMAQKVAQPGCAAAVLCTCSMCGLKMCLAKVIAQDGLFCS